MRNLCELPINVVNDDEPKMLTGSDQKVRGKVSALRFRTAQSAIPPAYRRTLSRHGQIMRNMVSPYFSFSER